MKHVKTAFPWDSIKRIFGLETAFNPQQLLQKPELIESDMHGKLKWHSGKPDVPLQELPGGIKLFSALPTLLIQRLILNISEHCNTYHIRIDNRYFSVKLRKG